MDFFGLVRWTLNFHLYWLFSPLHNYTFQLYLFLVVGWPNIQILYQHGTYLISGWFSHVSVAVFCKDNYPVQGRVSSEWDENALFQKVTGSVTIYWISFSWEIADQEKISKKYLGTILRLLRNFNLLESKRVKIVYYRSLKDQNDIYLAEFISHIYGPISILPFVSLNYYASFEE